MKYYLAVNHKFPRSPGAFGELEAVLYPEDGQEAVRHIEPFCGEHFQDYDAYDPDGWVLALEKCVRFLLAESGISKNQISSVSFSSLPKGYVLLGADGHPVMPAADLSRHDFHRERQLISKVAEEDEIIRITGSRFLPGSTLSYLLWYRSHFPKEYIHAVAFLSPKDYLGYFLTGNIATDPSDASYTQLMDITDIAWSENLFARFAIPESFRPGIVPAGKVLGKVRASAAAITGLAPGTNVIEGATNKGVIELTSMTTRNGEGELTVNLTGSLQIHSEKAQIDPTGCAQLVCSCIPGEYMILLSTRTCLNAYNWIGRTLYPGRFDPVTAKGGTPFALLEEQAAGSTPGAGGIFFLPYLRGEETPCFDDRARGVFAGISDRTEARDLVRAVMEGVVYSLRDCIDYARTLQIPLNNLYYRYMGSMPFTEQLTADITGEAVRGIRHGAPSLGLYMLMAVQDGVYADLKEASDARGSAELLAVPNPAYREIYDSGTAVYKELYPALEKSFAALDQFRRVFCK